MRQAIEQDQSDVSFMNCTHGLSPTDFQTRGCRQCDENRRVRNFVRQADQAQRARIVKTARMLYARLSATWQETNPKRQMNAQEDISSAFRLAEVFEAIAQEYIAARSSIN